MKLFNHGARGVKVKNFAIGAQGLGFDSLTHQIGHAVGNGLSPPQHFCGAVLSRH